MKIEIKHKYIENPIEEASFKTSGSANVVVHVNSDDYHRVVFKNFNGSTMSFTKEDFKDFTDLVNKINEQVQGGM